MGRLALVALVMLAAATHANAAKLDAKLVKAVKKAGFAKPTAVADSGSVQVLVGQKGKKRHVLLVSGAGADPIVVVDGGEVGVPRATVSATFGGPFAGKGIDAITIVYDSTNKAGATVHEAWHWLVRPQTLDIACVIKGDATYDPGPKCGSGGYDRTSVAIVQGTTSPTFDVTFNGAGTYSRPNGSRGCQQSSPVRQSQTQVLYVVPAAGLCVQRAVLTGAAKVIKADELVNNGIDSDAVIGKVRGSYVKQVTKCYQDALNNTAAVGQGTVDVTVDVTSAGRTSVSAVKGFDAAVDACIEATAKKWIFDNRAKATATYLFVFRLEY